MKPVLEVVEMRLKLRPALAHIPLSVSILKMPLLCPLHTHSPHAQAIVAFFVGNIAAWPRYTRCTPESGMDGHLYFSMPPIMGNI